MAATSIFFIASSPRSALGRGAPFGHRVRQHAWGDLPADAPSVLAPAALTFLPAMADDRVPVSVGLCLVVGRDLEGEGLVVLELRPAIEADARDAATVNSTTRASPSLPSG
jgi:hypothetical protein